MDKEVIQRNVLNFWKELYVGDEYENTEGRSLAKDEEQEESTGVEYKDHILGQQILDEHNYSHQCYL